MSKTFFCIVPPVSPWDAEHREAIELDHARRTIGTTAGEAWNLQCRAGTQNLDAQEISRRTQFWHDRGYRLKEITLTLGDDNG